MAIASASTTKSSEPLNRHVRQDETDGNNHYPKGFLNASAGDVNWHTWEAIPFLPSVLDLRDVMAAEPASPSDGDTYLLDDSGETYTVSAINWQSGNTVRYTFSGTPDLSGISATNLLVSTGAVNSEHDGVFVITAVSDPSDYIDVTNTNITDATLDETVGATCEAPHEDWSGGVNNDWVRWNAADGVWYSVSPISGQKVFDKTLEQDRRFDGTRWLGQKELIALAAGSETASHTTGTAKTTFHMPFKFRITNVIAGVTTAPTGSTLDVDLNDDGTSIFSTVITIDAGEKTSSTAATPAVIDSTKAVVAADSLMTIDIDQIGSTIAGAGLKVYIEGYRV
jgi:hypothetical protein